MVHKINDEAMMNNSILDRDMQLKLFRQLPVSVTCYAGKLATALQTAAS